MKNWMKILMWLGLGGGIGFFAGYQLGAKVGEKRVAQASDVSYVQGYSKGYSKAISNRTDYDEALGNYRGDADDGEPEDDVEMPEEEPVIGDEEVIEVDEIPELHPTHMIPQLITEDGYYENPWRYDQEDLLFFETDQVLFNKTTRKAIRDRNEMDETIGIGMVLNFYMKDGEVLDAIFVRNDTAGMLYRIDRIDGSYDDDPIAAEDEPEEDDE